MSTNNNQYGKEVKPIWKDKSAESQKIMKLSGAKLQSMTTNNLASCTALTLSNRGITKLEDFVGFSDLLHRVDLSGNGITRLQGFNSTPGISMLNISSNEIAGDASLEDLRYLTELRTLNIGNNMNIKYIRSHVAKPLQKLQALIAHECGFEKISFLKFIPQLNTLILSKNSISDFSVNEVGSLIYLTKLSISHNMLKSIPDLSASINLTELRVNHNLITSISDSILGNKKLKTLDLSHNLLTDWEDVRKLVGLQNLTNLGLKSNKLPSPPESTDEIEVREDKAAEGIEDVKERRYRRFVLSIFLRFVGLAKKSFEQLIVLDMKRVKMKLTPGMSKDDTENLDKENEIVKKDQNSVEKNNTKIVSKSINQKAAKVVNKQNSNDESNGDSNSGESKKPILSIKSKTTSNKRSLQPHEETEEKGSLDKESDSQFKKSKKVKNQKSSEEAEGFLNQTSNDDDKVLKSVKPADNSSSAAVSSGVLSVTIHKKDAKSTVSNKNIKKKDEVITITGKPNDSEIIPSNAELKKGEKKPKNEKVDNVSVTNIFAGDNAFIVGGGGSSTW